jgi:diguanylate cyclase (GGDEF)-like protein
MKRGTNVLRRLIETVTAMTGQKRSNNRKRVLVHEILTIQILSASIIGALAIAALYWGGQWVLQDNYSRWALQWTEELNELGAPLYLDDDGEALIRLESFVDKYPEIAQVGYFDANGKTLFSINAGASTSVVSDLSPNTLEDAILLIGSETPYQMKTGALDPRQFEILAPVWTESLPDDGLFAFNPGSASLEPRMQLVGFIGIHLNFNIFHNQLQTNIKTAILVLLVMLIVFSLTGRRALQRALSSISDLQQPIQELAEGNLDVQFKPAEHREISDIVEALETTATALSERDAKLLELANHDVLTGLFNRRRFVDELEAELVNAEATKSVCALFFVDLDQFKYVNDSCGHPAGDRLIRKVADELLRSVGQDDTVARFGGDEFVILIRNSSRTAAKASADRVLANMRRLAHIEDQRVFHVHCSIGITLIDGNNRNADDLIAQADIACRDAKSAGRNRAAFYEQSEEKSAQVTEDVGWMNKLRNAIDEDGFVLHYQPINRIDSGQTTHHEVLIRLPEEDGRLVAPDAFFPAAIRFGLMSEIDFWMIKNAAKAYSEHAKDNAFLKLSINLSANAFEHEDLSSYVASCFSEHGVIPSNIIFEITESLAVRRPRHVEQQIDELRKLGCQLALDDFGTGYSSLSSLQKLHFDFIKIDGTFVQDILSNTVDQKMIRLIAEIGREMNMQTVAEYVQDADALALLGDLGVDLAQGFFIGRPSDRPVNKHTPISLSCQRKKRLQV